MARTTTMHVLKLEELRVIPLPKNPDGTPGREALAEWLVMAS